MTVRRIAASVFLLFACALGSTVHAAAQTQGTASIRGTVVDATSQAVIAGARLELRGATTDERTTSDTAGHFSFDNLSPASYTLSVAASGYASGTGNAVALGASEVATVSVALQPLTTTSLKQIAVVSVSGQRSVNTTSAPIVTITKQEFVKNGQVLVEQGLEQTPGITVQHFDGGLGSVATLTIRGAGGIVGGSNTGYEVLVLQDGEPVRNGQYGDFDLSTLTPSIYRSVQVVKGVGGTSLFGANAIGGTLNLQTIDPLATAGGQLIGTVGSFNTTSYDLSATNTMGKFGYVADVHRLTSTGNFPANFVADYTNSGCNSTCLWHPSQDFNLQSGLLKLKYAFSPSTYVTLTGQDEADIRNQLGLLTNPTTDQNGNAFDAAGIPFFYGYPGDYVTNIQPKISLDFHTLVAGGNLELRTYGGILQRVVDGNGEPPGVCCYLQRSLDRLYGDELLWTKATERNELTLGYGGNGDSFFYGSKGAGNPLSFNNLAFNQQGAQIERTALVRDEFQATQRLKIDFTGYYSSYDTLNVKRFDPRLGLVYRPDASSAVHFSLASGFAPPRLSDLYTPLSNYGGNASFDPRCPASYPNQNCVGSSGNANLGSETAVGYDLGFDKAFAHNTGSVSFDLYRTNLNGHILYADEPAPAGTGNFSGGSVDGLPILFVNKPINLASAVYSGFELNARIPIVKSLAATGFYTTQAAYPLGVDPITEANVGDLVNNQQFDGVPLHQAGYGLDYRRNNGVEFFANGVYFGSNNSYAVPAFWVYNTGAVLPLDHGNQFNVAWTNIGNKNATIYSLYNGGQPYPGIGGPYATTAHPYQPTTILFTFSHAWGSLAPGASNP